MLPRDGKTRVPKANQNRTVRHGEAEDVVVECLGRVTAVQNIRNTPWVTGFSITTFELPTTTPCSDA